MASFAMFDGAAILMNIAHPVNKVEPVLAGQQEQHHKPPEVLKSQVFWFWSAGGILTAIKIIKIKLVSETQNHLSGLQNEFTFCTTIIFSSNDAQVVNR